MVSKDVRDLTVEKSVANKRLDKLKRIEQKTELYSKRLNSRTIVFCKRKENIAEYEKTMNF